MTLPTPASFSTCEHGGVALGVEGDPLLLGLGDLLLAVRVDGLVGVVAELGQALEGDAGQGAAAAEVAARDQVPLRVAGQPVTSRAEQLVDLVAGLPVVLGLVEHGQQDVELVERVGQPHRAAQGHVQVARVAPLRELLVQRDRRRVDRPPERLEDLEREIDAAAAGQHGDHDLERDRPVGQLLAAVAAAGRGRC